MKTEVIELGRFHMIVETKEDHTTHAYGSTFFSEDTSETDINLYKDNELVDPCEYSRLVEVMLEL